MTCWRICNEYLLEFIYFFNKDLSVYLLVDITVFNDNRVQMIRVIYYMAWFNPCCSDVEPDVAILMKTGTNVNVSCEFSFKVIRNEILIIINYLLLDSKIQNQILWNWLFLMDNFALLNIGMTSSRAEMFLRKGVLIICSRFIGDHPSPSVISIKLLCNFIEITHWHVCSPVNLLHILRTTFPKNTCGRLLLEWSLNIWNFQGLWCLSTHFSPVLHFI